MVRCARAHVFALVLIDNDDNNNGIFLFESIYSAAESAEKKKHYRINTHNVHGGIP